MVVLTSMNEPGPATRIFVVLSSYSLYPRERYLVTTGEKLNEMIRLLKLIAENQNRMIASLRAMHTPNQRMNDLENSR